MARSFECSVWLIRNLKARKNAIFTLKTKLYVGLALTRHGVKVGINPDLRPRESNKLRAL